MIKSWSAAAYPDHARSWDWVARALREDFHVIAPDLRVDMAIARERRARSIASRSTCSTYRRWPIS